MPAGGGNICTSNDSSIASNNLRGALACLVFAGLCTLVVAFTVVIRLIAPVSVAAGAAALGAPAMPRRILVRFSLAALIFALLGLTLPAAVYNLVNVSMNGAGLGLAIVTVIIDVLISVAVIVDALLPQVIPDVGAVHNFTLDGTVPTISFGQHAVAHSAPQPGVVYQPTAA